MRFLACCAVPIVAFATAHADPAPPKLAPVAPAHGSRLAWTFVGTAAAFTVIGGVLAYAAHSSEADLEDLYVGPTGKTPTYDAATARRYAELVHDGTRYEHLAWASFGIAGACAITSAILFARGGEPTVIVAPAASPTSAGLSALVRF